MSKHRNIIVWSMMVVVLLLFWFSIRSTVYQMEFTLAALGVWGLTYLINRNLKNEEDQEER